MLFKRHTALQLVCLYAVVAVICIPGPALSARRYNSQKGEHRLFNVQEHTSAKANTNISVSKLAATRRSESCFASQSLAKRLTPCLPDIRTYVVAAWDSYTASSILLLKTYSRLLLPGYYSFLFRYTPF